MSVDFDVWNPEYEAGKWVIDRKINIMKEEGVEFITNANVGKDIKPANS